MNAEIPVERHPRIPLPELEREFFDKDKPVILTDAPSMIPDWKRWTLRQVRASHTDKSVFVRGGCRMVWRTLCRVPVPTYLDYVFGEGDLANNPVTPYAELNPYAAYNQLAFEELDLSNWIPKHYASTAPNLWMGPKKAMTPLHNDELGVNLFLQFEGKKRFIVYPTEQLENVYPSDIFDFGSRFSQVNLDAPDHDRFPKFRDAKPTVIDLQAGEMLILPRDWFHEVHTLEDSLSLNVWIERRDRHARRLKWNARGIAHLFGLYKNNHCLCHIWDLTPHDLERVSPALRVLVKMRMRGHGKDLADMLGWKKSKGNA